MQSTPMAQPLAGGEVAIAMPADLSLAVERIRLTPAALKGFFRLMAAWRVTEVEARALLGGVSHGRYIGLKKAAETGGEAKPLSQDELTRISYLVGIAKALRIIHAKALADEWVRLPNGNLLFGGGTPLAYMIAGGIPAMATVRDLVDARRGFLA